MITRTVEVHNRKMRRTVRVAQRDADPVKAEEAAMAKARGVWGDKPFRVWAVDHRWSESAQEWVVTVDSVNYEEGVS